MWKNKLAVLVCILAMPVTMAIGILCFDDRKYMFVSYVIIFLSILVVFFCSEKKSWTAKEVIMIASLVAIASIGRALFSFLPQFKPVTAVVIIAAVTLGPQYGMLVGTMTGLVSNLFFGQGPWTPYQMFAWGLIGYFAGLIFQKRKINKWTLSLYGFLATMMIYGGILNFASILMFTTTITKEMILSYYIQGIPFDLVHAGSTVVFLYFITNPMIHKIERIKVKYGICGNEEKYEF